MAYVKQPCRYCAYLPLTEAYLPLAECACRPAAPEWRKFACSRVPRQARGTTASIAQALGTRYLALTCRATTGLRRVCGGFAARVAFRLSLACRVRLVRESLARRSHVVPRVGIAPRLRVVGLPLARCRRVATGMSASRPYASVPSFAMLPLPMTRCGNRSASRACLKAMARKGLDGTGTDQRRDKALGRRAARRSASFGLRKRQRVFVGVDFLAA